MKLVLTYEQRCKSRLRVADAAFALPRGKTLHAGERIKAVDGREFEVVCAAEKLLHIEAGHLARVAYHLGNRHVPLQVGKDFLCIAEDHVLEDLVRRLGASVSQVEAPFDPESGAYSHQHDEMGHGGKIHDHHHK